MRITQEDFERACGRVSAVVTEHRGDGDDGIHGALRSLGLNPPSAIDVAGQIVSDAPSDLAFIAGLLVGVQLAQGAGD
jgi:hypothetical protein